MMEEINDAISANNQQQTTTTTTIVSGNGTNVTQVMSQTLDDFEPDPKWEITTLEKASYDCGEVVDSIVELGGCQQFAQTLDDQQQEDNTTDRDREVENIRREITGQNDLIAEALQPNILQLKEQHKEEEKSFIDNQKPASESSQTFPDLKSSLESLSEEQHEDKKTVRDREVENIQREITGQSNLIAETQQPNTLQLEEPLAKEENSVIDNQKLVSESSSKYADLKSALGSLSEEQHGDKKTVGDKEVENIRCEVTGQSNLVAEAQQPITLQLEETLAKEENSVIDDQKPVSESSSKYNDLKSALGSLVGSLSEKLINEEQIVAEEPVVEQKLIVEQDPVVEQGSIVEEEPIVEQEPTVEQEQKKDIEEAKKEEVEEERVEAKVDHGLKRSRRASKKLLEKDDSGGSLEPTVEQEQKKDIEEEKKEEVEEERVEAKVDHGLKRSRRATKRLLEKDDSGRSLEPTVEQEQKMDIEEEKKDEVEEERVEAKVDHGLKRSRRASKKLLEKDDSGRSLEPTVEQEQKMDIEEEKKEEVEEERVEAKVDHGLKRSRRATKKLLEKDDTGGRSLEPVIKAPLTSRSASSRMTISTSAPTTIPDTFRREDSMYEDDFGIKKYQCEKCKYSTSRLNNIVYHKKSVCTYVKGLYQASVEAYKLTLQSPKSNNKRR